MLASPGTNVTVLPVVAAKALEGRIAKTLRSIRTARTTLTNLLVFIFISPFLNLESGRVFIVPIAKVYFIIYSQKMLAKLYKLSAYLLFKTYK